MAVGVVGGAVDRAGEMPVLTEEVAEVSCLVEEDDSTELKSDIVGVGDRELLADGVVDFAASIDARIESIIDVTGFELDEDVVGVRGEERSLAEVGTVDFVDDCAEDLFVEPVVLLVLMGHQM
ncbi:hypothetical protein ES702_00177 [subsurface metagenome]